MNESWDQKVSEAMLSVAVDEINKALRPLQDDGARELALHRIEYCRFCGGKKISQGPFGPICYCEYCEEED